MRRRIVRPNTRSFTGRHVGTPGAETVRFESGLERDFLTLTRFRHDVVEIFEQPFTVEFIDSAGRRRSYTPDFKVVYHHQTSVYEVKHKDELRAKWDQYREPYLHMRRWARQNGMVFRIMTDRSIRTIRFHNAQMLLPHRGRVPEPMMAERITAGLGVGPLAVGPLLKSVCREDGERGVFYATLWPMLASGLLRADFDRPLGMEFMVELAE